jgi:hypothetical protein
MSCTVTEIANVLNTKACTAKALKTYKKYQMLIPAKLKTAMPAPEIMNDATLLILSAELTPVSPMANKDQNDLDLGLNFSYVNQRVFTKHLMGHLKKADAVTIPGAAFSFQGYGYHVRLTKYNLKTNGVAKAPLPFAKAKVASYPYPLQKVNKVENLPISVLSLAIADVMHLNGSWTHIPCEQDHIQTVVDNRTILGCLVLSRPKKLLFLSHNELKQASILRAQAKAHPCATSLKLASIEFFKVLHICGQLKTTFLLTKAYLKSNKLPTPV